MGNRMANYSQRPKAMEPEGRKQLQNQKPGFQANMGVLLPLLLERGSMQQETGKVSLHKGLLFVLFEPSKFLRGFREKDGIVSLVDTQSKPTPFLSLENKFTEKGA